jgi:Zn-dependent peptidase ImmA (M78 family)/transcriptional regulator with XRE-family HTH domain
MARVKALVEPRLLIWARTSASMTVEDAARAIDVKEEKIDAWETGEDAPSIPQLKKLANAYKRPMSVMFLSEPPRDFMPLKDFRHLPDLGSRTLSRKLAFEIRSAQERRLVALDVLDELDEKPPVFGVRAELVDSPDEVAAALRDRIGVSIETQRRWRDPNKAFRAWRDAIEGSGVLVFALSGAHHQIPLAEVRGFAVAEDVLPVVVVNGQDGQHGRIFTLIHELAHIALGLSAIENSFEPGDTLPAGERAIETFCNRVAAATLMPAAALNGDSIIRGKAPGVTTWTDEEIEELAKRFSVSREALVIRLLQLERAAPSFVQRKRAEYRRYYADLAQQEKPAGRGGPPPHIQLLSHVGRGFAKLVLQGYHERRLSLNSVSAYLGTQAKHVAKIEQAAFSNAA